MKTIGSFPKPFFYNEMEYNPSDIDTTTIAPLSDDTSSYIDIDRKRISFRTHPHTVLWLCRHYADDTATM